MKLTFKIFHSLGAPCPNNYNPADYFIELVSIEPFREESCRQAVRMICDQFAKSGFGTKIAIEATSTVINYEDIPQSINRILKKNIFRILGSE